MCAAPCGLVVHTEETGKGTGQGVQEKGAGVELSYFTVTSPDGLSQWREKRKKGLLRKKEQTITRVLQRKN